ncbi:MAG TPA: hypothetical protein VGD59_13520 [Acidisarcina sp.]
MSGDLSVRNPSGTPLRVADALLRSLGGGSVSIRVPSGNIDASDAAQIGLSGPSFQDLPLSPSIFRKARVVMQEGQASKFEMLVSASAIEAQVNSLTLASADGLFAIALGMSVGDKFFLIEAVSAPEVFGQVYLYRILLREALPQGL